MLAPRLAGRALFVALKRDKGGEFAACFFGFPGGRHFHWDIVGHLQPEAAVGQGGDAQGDFPDRRQHPAAVDHEV